MSNVGLKLPISLAVSNVGLKLPISLAVSNAGPFARPDQTLVSNTEAFTRPAHALVSIEGRIDSSTDFPKREFSWSKSFNGFIFKVSATRSTMGSIFKVSATEEAGRRTSSLMSSPSKGESVPVKNISMSDEGLSPRKA